MSNNESMHPIESGDDPTFLWIARLLIADHRGNYEQALEAQRELLALGWYVFKKPPESTQKRKSPT